MPVHLADRDQGSTGSRLAVCALAGPAPQRPSERASESPSGSSRVRAPGQLLQVGPDNPAASNGRLREANRLLEQEDYDAAEPILTSLVKANPKDPEPLASLAVCVAAGRGQLATAAKLAERARRLAPHRGCGWFALGYVHLRGSRLEEGYRYLEEGRRRDPNDPRLRWGLEAWEARRPGPIADLAPDHPLNRLGRATWMIATHPRVLMAMTLYACYVAVSWYFRMP
jgi:tetratricopeptide (TPR) repeat protein